jgi:hypothetical protein
MAAFLFAQLFFAVYPILGRVPEAVIWGVEVILFVGAIVGAFSIVRVVRSASMRGRAAAWLLVVVVAELLCAKLFFELTVPWWW